MINNFIELTERGGVTALIGLRFVRCVRKEDDGGTLLFLADDSLPFRCRESFEDVRLMLLHQQPPDARVNEP